jgi:hypothetical protein
MRVSIIFTVFDMRLFLMEHIIKGKGKGKVRPIIRLEGLEGSRGVALLFLDLGARRGGCQHHAPAALPPGRTRYPLYRRLGGPKVRSGRVRKISPPPGFDPRSVQPVASRYTD